MEIDWWTIMCLIPFGIFLIVLFVLTFRCDDPTIVGEADGYQFRRCQCLNKGSTYRCSVPNNFFEGIKFFFRIGEYENVKGVYYFKTNETTNYWWE